MRAWLIYLFLVLGVKFNLMLYHLPTPYIDFHFNHLGFIFFLKYIGKPSTVLETKVLKR